MCVCVIETLTMYNEWAFHVKNQKEEEKKIIRSLFLSLSGVHFMFIHLKYVCIQFDRLRFRNVHSLWKFLQNRIILFFIDIIGISSRLKAHFCVSFLCFRFISFRFCCFSLSLSRFQFVFFWYLSTHIVLTHTQSKRTIRCHLICVWTNVTRTHRVWWRTHRLSIYALAGWLLFDFWFVAIFSI